MCTWRAFGLLLVAACTASLAFRSFEMRVARAFQSAEVAAPTRVFARPLVLHPGDRLSAARVRRRLERTGYVRTAAKSPGIGEFRMTDREWRIGRRALRIGAFFDPGGVARVRLDFSGRIRDITDANGGRLAGLVLDPEQVGTFRGADGRDRVPIRLQEVPPGLIDAVLTVEDRRFRTHSGLDPRRIMGAFVANLRERRLVQGGSTITQQLARTLFLTPERKVLRKVRETAIAFALERRFPKDRLLEAYLNHIYLGQNGGAAIHGVGRAAQFFFDKDVSELEVQESAMLAGIIRGPSVYSPHRHPDRARVRRDLVLRLMREEGLLSEEELATAVAAGLAIVPPRAPSGDGRWYLDYLEDELARSVPGRLQGAGLTIIATIEPAYQRAAERVVARQIERMERGRPRLTQQAQPLQAALVAVDPWTGEVLAMIGGRSYGQSQFNRATEAYRQPGSAFKPIVTLAAIGRDARRPFTLASVLEDEPFELETPSGLWVPSNSDREFRGRISLRQALEESRNVPFARLGLEIGAERIVETARSLGITSPLVPVPSLSLGASEVTLLELTAAYAVFAAEGERTPPHAVRTALDARGGRIGEAGRVRTDRVISPAEAYLMTSALRGVVEHGTGAGVRTAGYYGPVAAKSGTTNGSRDAWFVGYTPGLAVGVWVGFDDGTPLGLTGSQAALPMFADFLREVLGPDGDRDFRVPDGLEWRGIPTEQGHGFRCYGEQEVFLLGTAPRNACSRWGPRWRAAPRRSGEFVEDAEQWLRAQLRQLEVERQARFENGRPRRSGRPNR